jgi:hypothetical protein
MTDRDVSALLERAGDQILVLAPPVEAMVAEARRLRRRRHLTGGAAAAAVVAILGVANLVSTGPAEPDTDPTPPSSEEVVPPPAGMRYVGIGHAVIAVPAGWATNATRCGEPQQDTVVIDAGVTETCAGSRGADVQSVEVTEGDPPEGFTADRTYEVDGLRAESSPIRCGADGDGPLTCRAMVHLPTELVTFEVASSASVADVARARVSALLGRVRFLRAQVAVPGYADLAQDYEARSEAKYVADLRRLDLVPTVRTRVVPGARPGVVLDVEPRPGTVITRGQVVTVNVVAGARAPADEVAVGMSTVDAQDNYRTLSDVDIRRGATLVVTEGDDLWAYADGKRAASLSARQEGSSIGIDFWRNGPRWPMSWESIQPGTTRVTLSVRADGRRVDIGTVTVVVTPER